VIISVIFVNCIKEAILQKGEMKSDYTSVFSEIGIAESQLKMFGLKLRGYF